MCHVCPQARLHRKLFSHSTIKSSCIFELIHVDIWGPFIHAPYNGHRYFLTIVNDYSRVTWTHLFAHKHNAFSILQNFMAYTETQFGVHVKIIRNDNGIEFDEKISQTYYSSKGIVHQTSCVGTPQ